jgi:hypothetical protein
LRVLGFFAHYIAERENLYVGCEQIFEETGASSAGANDTDP